MWTNKCSFRNLLKPNLKIYQIRCHGTSSQYASQLEFHCGMPVQYLQSSHPDGEMQTKILVCLHMYWDLDEWWKDYLEYDCSILTKNLKNDILFILARIIPILTWRGRGKIWSTDFISSPMDFVESSTKFIETLLVEPCLGANDKLFLKFWKLFFIENHLPWSLTIIIWIQKCYFFCCEKIFWILGRTWINKKSQCRFLGFSEYQTHILILNET